VLLQLWYLTHRGKVQVQRRHLQIDPALMWKLVRLSGSGMVQVLIGSASWIGLVRVLAGFGAAALAGYTIGIRVVLFALLPAWGLSNAAATMVGQALGARKPERAERAVWLATAYNVAFLGAVGVLFVAGAGTIARLFASDPAVVPNATDCLRIVSYGLPLYAAGMVLSQSFNGAGDTLTPTLLNLCCFWFLEIPLAHWLATRAGQGPRGVFIAIAIAFSLLAMASAALFRRGKWKRRTL
jgi:Na+-driven multidrug efflux pump